MKKNSSIIIENQYFPVINLFKYSYKNKYIKLFACEGYKKMSFRNRCVIAGSNGLIPLSVPLQSGRNQKVMFKDVRISYDQDWQKNHWRTITSCYSRSPFFDFYRESLETFFFIKPVFLFDLNLTILQWLKTVLAHPAEIIVVEDLQDMKKDAEILDITNRWLPRNFQQGENGIRYTQVFEDRIGFRRNLSILDLLFNAGPMAIKIIADSLRNDNLTDNQLS